MKYVGKRFITLIITLLCISAVTFAAFSVIPGNASLTRLGTDATPEQVAALEHELGLDQPVTSNGSPVSCAETLVCPTSTIIQRWQVF